MNLFSFFWRMPKRTATVATALILSGIGSGFVFSERSKSNLDVCPPLIAVAEYAIHETIVDFMIIDGLRTDAEHQANLKKGVSWIKRSLHQDGLAIDVVAVIDGEISWNPIYYSAINDAFQKAAKKLNTPVIWGGSWTKRDYGHFELKNRVCFPDRKSADV